MDVLTAFGLNRQPNKSKLVALCGGGGKTTTMFSLARRFRMAELKVLVTTTTLIYRPEPEMYDYFCLGNTLSELIDNLPSNPQPGTIMVAGSGITAENKIKGLSLATVSQISDRQIYDIIMVEADGARGRPIKAPADYEPVIPVAASTVIGVVGMDCYGEPITETVVHRPQLFAALADRSIGALIDTETIIKLILSPCGLFKNAPAIAEKVLFLNKAERAVELEIAEKIGAAVLKEAGNIRRVVVGGILQPELLKTMERED